MTAPAPATTPTLPSTLKWAAWLAFTYAAVVIINATLLRGLSTQPTDYQVVIRAALFVLVGVGLLRRVRWARSLGLGLSFLFLGMRGIDLGLSLAFGTPWTHTELPRMAPPVAAVSTALLAAFVILVLQPQSRAAIRAAAV